MGSARHDTAGQLQPHMARLESTLRRKHSRQVLEVEIRKLTREVVYLESRLAAGRKQVALIEAERGTLEAQLPQLQQQMAELEDAYIHIRSELERLKLGETRLKQQKQALPAIQGQIDHLERALTYATRRRRRLRDQRDTAVREKEQLAAEVARLESECLQKEMENSVFERTRLLLQGTRPEGMAQKPFEALTQPGDVEEATAGYLEEIDQQMQALDTETSALRRQVTAIKQRPAQFQEQQVRLEAENADLQAEINYDGELSALEQEIRQQEQAHRAIRRESDAMTTEMKTLENNAEDLDRQLAREEQTFTQRSQRRERLSDLKRRLLDAGQLRRELVRLSAETHNHRVQTRINTELTTFFNDNQRRLSALNNEMRLALNKYTNLSTWFNADNF